MGALGVGHQTLRARCRIAVVGHAAMIEGKFTEFAQCLAGGQMDEDAVRPILNNLMRLAGCAAPDARFLNHEWLLSAIDPPRTNAASRRRAANVGRTVGIVNWRQYCRSAANAHTGSRRYRDVRELQEAG